MLSPLLSLLLVVVSMVLLLVVVVVSMVLLVVVSMVLLVVVSMVLLVVVSMAVVCRTQPLGSPAVINNMPARPGGVRSGVGAPDSTFLRLLAFCATPQ